MDAWRAVGLGLGIFVSACVVDFEDRPVYEVDTGTSSETTASSNSSSSGGGSNSNSNNSGSSNSGNNSSSSNGSGGDNSSSSNGSGGDGGTGGGSSSSSNNSTGGSSNSSNTSTGGGSSTNGSGGETSTTNGSASQTSTSSGGGSGGGPIDDCDGTDTSCSACNNVGCVSAAYCCGDVSFFAGQTLPEWVDMPELITDFSENDAVSVSASFTGANQLAAIAYVLDYDMLMYNSLVIDATVSGGWTLTVSLEDRVTGSGCVYTTGNVVEVFDYPDNCWGDFAGYLLYPSDFYFNQINVRIESLSSGAGTGTLTISGMTLD